VAVECTLEAKEVCLLDKVGRGEERGFHMDDIIGSDKGREIMAEGLN
jgi:hypothetical protein